MQDLIWVAPAIPILSFVILALFGYKFERPLIAVIGVGSVALSALFSIIIATSFLISAPASGNSTIALWEWLNIGGFEASLSFRLDSLSLVFVFIITFVGFLICVYSAEFMAKEEGYSRFFAYMNLFIGAMLILVLADDLLLLYLGWEGVGLSSYLLIGFWYKNPQNGNAARKAFIVTRIGDTAMALGLFLLISEFNSLNIQTTIELATANWSPDSGIAVAATALLLGGALGKSAQLPLQIWLPDAMAGPSPVSALIHAATMVTAGVYLIARLNALFLLAPIVLNIIAIIGLLTLLVAGLSALTQRDIKRVLAYSTISQIGYMFLALGVGAFSAGVFHFFTHAFFKALLFLSAGAVILAQDHEHDMFKMGGLRKKMPVIYWTFLSGAASLAALPLITAGFYSKDAILWYSFASAEGGLILLIGALIGAFITALYTFRMVFLTFFGDAKIATTYSPTGLIKIPLIILAALSLIVGFIDTPHSLGNVKIFSNLFEGLFPIIEISQSYLEIEWVIQIIAGVITLSGVFAAYYFYILNPRFLTELESNKKYLLVKNFLLEGWKFDRLYKYIFVLPLTRLATINKNDFIDKFYSGIAAIALFFSGMLGITQSGRVRDYALGITLGVIILITIAAIL